MPAIATQIYQGTRTWALPEKKVFAVLQNTTAFRLNSPANLSKRRRIGRKTSAQRGRKLRWARKLIEWNSIEYPRGCETGGVEKPGGEGAGFRGEAIRVSCASRNFIVPANPSCLRKLARILVVPGAPVGTRLHSADCNLAKSRDARWTVRVHNERERKREREIQHKSGVSGSEIGVTRVR